MKLYVMRHAEAIERNGTLQDVWRYLTEKGRTDAEKVASSVVRNGPKPRLTITSPLTRAVQTAEIAAAKACRKNVVVASELLLPGGDINELATYLKGCGDSRRVMVVGHEPQLGQLVELLLGLENSGLVLKKGSCVALELDPEKNDKPATFLWYLAPGKKTVRSLKKAFPER